MEEKHCQYRKCDMDSRKIVQSNENKKKCLRRCPIYTIIAPVKNDRDKKRSEIYTKKWKSQRVLCDFHFFVSASVSCIQK